MDTLVVLMGVGNLPVIAEQLLNAGRESKTPATMIRWGTTPRQQVVTATLGTIAERASRVGIRPPAVLIVGGVVSLQDELRWYDTRPLFGLQVLVTRPREKAAQTAAQLRDLGAEPVIFPTIAIRPPESWKPLDTALEDLPSTDWVVFTSTNGVRFFWQRLREIGRDARALAGTRLAAIGPVTGRELAKHGLQADLIPDEYVAEALLDHIGPVDGKRILLPRADIARPLLTDGLRAAGAEVNEVTAYRTVPAASEDVEQIRRMLTKGEIDVLTFTSSSTVRNFVASLRPLPDLPQGITVACIGPITAQTAEESGLPVHVSAREHTIEGLLSALVEHVAGKTNNAA
jgi:uroporphyrinogen III methyltransferase/synthase